ncbi:MAG TPA: hypothetical protein DDX39_09200 [Bacteroidales bacterium]|nr:MAG: hypothetical protein A2W98_15105 [Bacteroidetes bacterium GWF2_33_38]OFY91179.1 MAG: hypothetical protein A2236_00680 [Bacteroidetes bacterium RIFOXYA2_FULL_33_7]HBF88805.1 hypothetical protein [Bacteroidales bacterium]
MPILNSIVSWLNIKRLYQIELFKKYPIEVQEETFNKLIKKAKDTEWGVKYHYKTIQSVEQFKNRVPIQDYEKIKPYVTRLRQGEQNLLWPTDIKWFAKSSGTTADKSKFIPVSKEAIEDCHFRGGKDIIAIYTQNNPETGILSGKGLALGGAHQVNNFSNESYYGDVSAILIQNLPFWAEFIRTPNLSIALMSEWEEKLEKMSEATVNENVTNIAGVPSWMLVLLKNILEKTGKTNILDIWPNLEVFIHGGVSFLPYREHFKQIIKSDKMNYLETYNASEGFFSIQDDPTTDDMLLMLDYGIFYEFIAMENIDKPHPKTLMLDEVEIGKNYAMLITTNAGLWRYLIGDTVKFTSKYPFKIKITGRTKHYINVFGEELIIDNAESAIKVACEKTHAMVREYTAAPIFMNQDEAGGHEWLFEFEKAPESLDYFADVLDNALKAVNSDYEAKRYKNMALKLPKLTSLKYGVFYTWLKEKQKLGGQHKIPRLSNSRDYVEQLLDINSKMKND